MDRDTINRFASREGWAIFALDSLGSQVEIQRDDEMDIFASDDAAVAFVAGLSDAGSHLHRVALRLVGFDVPMSDAEARSAD